MFRGCISLLVIAGFLASQLAAIPHAHGAALAEEQQKHDSTPHFHCGWLGNGDHDHSPGGHGDSRHNHRHKGDEKPSSGDSDSRPVDNDLSGTDHDADALFASKQVVAVSITKDQVGSAWQVAAFASVPIGLDDLQPRRSPTLFWHPPEKVLDASDTYLTLRNLRI